MLDQELIVYLTERSQSGDPLTAEEFAEALEDGEVAERFAALSSSAPENDGNANRRAGTG